MDAVDRLAQEARNAEHFEAFFDRIGAVADRDRVGDGQSRECAGLEPIQRRWREDRMAC